MRSLERIATSNPRSLHPTSNYNPAVPNFYTRGINHFGRYLHRHRMDDMSDYLADNLLQAASHLDRLGRDESARILLEGVLKAPRGFSHLQETFDEVANEDRMSFALLCLEVLVAYDPLHKKDILERGWTKLEQITLGRLMGPELFKARLRQLTAEPICDDPETIGSQSRPDIVYILALSLPQDATGYAMRTQSLVTAMKKQAVKIHCLTRPGFPWNRGFEGPTGKETVGAITYYRSGDPGHRIPNDLASFCAAERELVAILKKLRPKMVMAASNHGTAIPAFFAARRLGLPFVYDVRGFWELSRALREPEWGKSEAFSIACELEALVASEADMVLTLTSSMQRELERRGVDGGRIRIVPNAADPDQFIPHSRSAELAQRLGIPPDVPVIGYVGSFNFYEGLDDLVAAGALLAKRGYDFRMLLIGSDSHPHIPIADSLRRQAEQSGIRDRLILPGQIAAEEVAEWYSLIDIAPIPRKDVAVTQLVSPIKPLEAMAMGKAVVVSDLTPLVEIVGHDSIGLTYPAGKSDELAKTLELLLQDSDLRQRLGVAARKWIVENRNWNAVATAARLAFEEIIR